MSRNLRNWLSAYVEYTQETESPKEYHFWVGASLISAATKRQVWLEMNYFQIFPNMYVILVGPSGARKSVATGIGMQIASKVGLKKFSEKITGAALIRDLSNATEQRMEPGNPEIQLVSPIMIYASELGVFMGADAYGSGVIADLTDLYDCPPSWEKKTISRDAELVHQPYVTMLAASTPQTLKDVIPQGAVGQGFTSRILFIWGGGRRQRIPIPPWGTEYEMLRHNLVVDLEKISKLRGQFKFSPDGYRAYHKHYMEHAEPEDEFNDERLRGYSSRKDVHTLKLAMVVSLADKDELVITEENMAQAIASMKWLDQGLMNVFAGHGAATSSQDVVRIFNQINDGTRKEGYVTHSDLLKKNYYHVNAQDFAMIIETLKQASAIEEIIGKDLKTQKPIRVYKAIDKNFIPQPTTSMPKSMDRS